jgi:HSP20 family protein
MGVMKWDPFREMHTLQDRMNRLFEEASQGWKGRDVSGTSWSPALDIYETEREIVLQAELPGFDRRDIALDVRDNLLTVSGNRPFEKATREENYHRIERSYGAFSRSFTIPSVVDGAAIRADYAGGVLTVVLPKTAESGSRQIEITI